MLKTNPDHCPNCGFKLTGIEEVNPRKCRTCGDGVDEGKEFYVTMKRGKVYTNPVCTDCLKLRRCKNRQPTKGEKE